MDLTVLYDGLYIVRELFINGLNYVELGGHVGLGNLIIWWTVLSRCGFQDSTRTGTNSKTRVFVGFTKENHTNN